MKILVTYVAYNQRFSELFDKGVEVKKITTRIKNFCPTGYIVNIEEISEENAKDFVDFLTVEAKYKQDMDSSLSKINE